MTFTALISKTYSIFNTVIFSLLYNGKAIVVIPDLLVTKYVMHSTCYEWKI